MFADVLTAEHASLGLGHLRDSPVHCVLFFFSHFRFSHLQRVPRPSVFRFVSHERYVYTFFSDTLLRFSLPDLSEIRPPAVRLGTAVHTWYLRLYIAPSRYDKMIFYSKSVNVVIFISLPSGSQSSHDFNYDSVGNTFFFFNKYLTKYIFSKIYRFQIHLITHQV